MTEIELFGDVFSEEDEENKDEEKELINQGTLNITNLFLGAVKNGDLDAVKSTIEQGADVTAFHYFAFYSAAENGHHMILAYLIGPTFSNIYGVIAKNYRAFFVALENNHIDVVGVIIFSIKKHFGNLYHIQEAFWKYCDSKIKKSFYPSQNISFEMINLLKSNLSPPTKKKAPIFPSVYLGSERNSNYTTYPVWEFSSNDGDWKRGGHRTNNFDHLFTFDDDDLKRLIQRGHSFNLLLEVTVLYSQPTPLYKLIPDFQLLHKHMMVYVRRVLYPIALVFPEFPALVTLLISDQINNWTALVPFHLKWDIITHVKHFHNHPSETQVC